MLLKSTTLIVCFVALAGCTPNKEAEPAVHSENDLSIENREKDSLIPKRLMPVDPKKLSREDLLQISNFEQFAYWSFTYAKTCPDDRRFVEVEQFYKSVMEDELGLANTARKTVRFFKTSSTANLPKRLRATAKHLNCNDAKSPGFIANMMKERIENGCVEYSPDLETLMRIGNQIRSNDWSDKRCSSTVSCGQLNIYNWRTYNDAVTVCTERE